MMDKFPDAPVAVTLTGAQWAAILGRIDRPEELSDLGKRTYREGISKLCDQLLAAQKAIQKPDYKHTPNTCPSKHWNPGNDVCQDCGLDLQDPDGKRIIPKSDVE